MKAGTTARHRRGRGTRRAMGVVAGVLAQMSASAAFAAIDDHWNNPAGGTWDDSGNWSLNAAPTNTSYNAIIDLQTGSPYEVDIVDDFSVAGITLNSADATVVQSAGTVTTPILTLDAGTFELNGGTLTSATVNLAGGNFQIMGGTLNGVTVTGGDLQVQQGQELIIQNGLTITGHNLDVASGGAVYFDGDSQTINNLTIAGAHQAQLIVGGPTSNGGASLTLASTTSVTGGFYFQDYVTGGTLINDGTLSVTDTNTEGYAGYIGDATFTNNGLLTASTGTTVEINSTQFTNTGTVSANRGTVSIDAANWNNAGVFTASSGTFNLGGNFSTAGIGSIVADNASTIQITGTDDNTNATLKPTSGNWSLNEGTITGGTIDQSITPVVMTGGTLDGVNVIGGDLQVSAGDFVTILNGVTVANHNVDLAAGARLTFEGTSNADQTASNLNITANNGEAYLYVGGFDSTGAASLTLAASTTVSGAFTFDQIPGNSTLTNDGLMNADDGANPSNIYVSNFINNGIVETTAGAGLTISSPTFTNNGTLESVAGSTLTIDSANFVENGTLLTQGAIQTTGGLTVQDTTVNLSSGLLQTGAAGSLALSGMATINQSGTSTANVQGPLIVAPTAGDQAAYNISAGTLTAQQGAAIGANGAGTFTQTGGMTTITGVLGAGNSGSLGSGSGTGVINISGGSLYADTILLGSTTGGSGDMTVSGAANVTVGGGAHLNDLNVNGGTFTVLDQAPPAGEDPELNRAIVGGYLTDGALNVGGGTVVSPLLKLGITSGKTGTFTESSGNVTLDTLSAGNDGTLSSGSGNGIVNIYGGSLYADTVLLGSTAGGSGDMTVSGAASVTIGGGAHLNDLNVTGGSVTVLNQDPPTGEDPELNRALVGGYLSNGALIVSGGVVTSPNIKLGLTSGMTGTFNLSGGTVDVGTLGVGNDASMTSGSGIGTATVSSGVLIVDTLLLGSSAGGSGDMTVSGSASVTIGGGAHLNDLNVNGGTVTVLDQAPPTGEDPVLNRALVGGYLTNGALNVSGGVVTTPNIKLGITGKKTGTFSQTAGIVNVGTLAIGDDASLSSGAGLGIANLSGGTLSVGTILIGSSAGGIGSLNISASAAVEATHAITFSAGSHFNFTGGNLTLNGATLSTPADPYTIGDGADAAELHVHNSIVSSGGATVTIAANATLDGGSGATSQDIAAQNVGSAAFSNTNLSFSGSSSTLHLTLGGDPAPANAGTGYDQIEMSNGVFTVGGATLQILPLSNIVLNQPYPIVIASGVGLIDYSSVFSRITTDTSFGSGVYDYSVSCSATEIDLTVSSTPEPGATALLAVGGMMLLRRRRRATHPRFA